MENTDIVFFGVLIAILVISIMSTRSKRQPGSILCIHSKRCGHCTRALNEIKKRRHMHNFQFIDIDGDVPQEFLSSIQYRNAVPHFFNTRNGRTTSGYSNLNTLYETIGI